MLHHRTISWIILLWKLVKREKPKEVACSNSIKSFTICSSASSFCLHDAYSRDYPDYLKEKIDLSFIILWVSGDT